MSQLITTRRVLTDEQFMQLSKGFFKFDIQGRHDALARFNAIRSGAVNSRAVLSKVGQPNPTRSRAELTEEIVLHVREEFEGGYNQKALVAKFGLHRETISKIINRKIWNHV